MTLNRREFILSSGAAFLIAGCRTRSLFGAPDMSFGVISDIHVTTPKSCRLFEKSLRYFKRRGVDAVMVAGDLTDWGLRDSLVLVKRTWDKVFAGTDVVPLFCTGNHDYEGWWYGDMTMEMHANGYSEADRLYRAKDDATLAKAWEEVFGEKFEPVRLRTVKGYDFISGEYHGYAKLGDFLTANAARLRGEKPFFYFQHVPVKGTTADSFGWGDNGVCKPLLDPFPNCISFNGHTHRPFLDERSVWQGSFTQIAIPSLSYASLPKDYENGSGLRNGKPVQAMQIVPVRRDLRGGQGYFVDVWNDKVVCERIDLEEEDSDSPAWVIPLGKDRPFAAGVRDAAYPVPAFPADATLELETRNTENRDGHWAIVLNCEFPSATMPAGARVYDYEIRAVPQDGSKPLVKKFISPAFAKMAKFEPERQRFWFDVAELPQDKPYVIEVRAGNCFGKQSAPLVSGVRRGKPGLEKADRNI